MASKPVFREHCQDKGIEHMLSVACRDTSIAISTLRTFSCESDMELIDSFNSQGCFVIDDVNTMIHTRSQDKRKTDPKQQQNCFLQPKIVTPPKLCATTLEISLDPLPEHQVHPLLLHVGSDDQKSASEKELGLLFPNTDPGYLSTTTLDYKTPLPPERSPQNIPKDGPSNFHSIASNLCDTCVYKNLWPSLPLPGSFGPILCLLLHMELSPKIHQAIVTQACEIVNEQWKEHAKGLCSMASSGREIQNISGNIVDKLVETLGPLVDLPVLFHASAQIYNDFTDSEDDRLSIFFLKNIESEAEETELQVVDDGMAKKPWASNVATDCECTASKKRKARASNEDDSEKTCEKIRTVFVPTVLQLAIAYGANYSTIENGHIKSGQMSLEKYVVEKSSQLQCMEPTERSDAWNDMVKVWRDRGGTS